MVAERMVSVRPCLKPDVLADSYVEAAVVAHHDKSHVRVYGLCSKPEWPYMR